MLNIIDVFDRNIVDYHIGFHCEAKDATALLRCALIRRNLFEKDAVKPVIRTDNESQFVSYRFKECCENLRLYHERIPVKAPNKNAHVESFYRILEDKCFKINEFESYIEIYDIVNDLITFYNNRRLHSRLGYMTHKEFYQFYSE